MLTIITLLSLYVNLQYQELQKVWILLYLEANRISFYSFMDTGRRHKIHRSKTKDSVLLTALTVARMAVFVPISCCHKSMQRQPDNTCIRGGLQ